MALQPANLNRLLPSLVHYASAFAKHFCGTHAAAACAENVGLEYHARGTSQVPRVDFLDERRDVDMRRTRLNARRIETVETSSRLDGRLARRHGRHKFRK